MPRSIEAARVFLAADQHPHLGDARQVRGVQTADGARSDDENALQVAVSYQPSAVALSLRPPLLGPFNYHELCCK